MDEDEVTRAKGPLGRQEALSIQGEEDVSRSR